MDMTRDEWSAYQESLKVGDDFAAAEVIRRAEERSQSAKADKGKLDITLVPTQAIRDIAEVRMYGTKKYGNPENWKQVSVERYAAALGRHYLDFLDDPLGVDEESGIPHYKHMICNCAFICALLGFGKEEQECTKKI